MIEPQITYRGMAHSAAMDSKISGYAQKLEEYHPRITRCHVTVAEGDRKKHKGNHFEVHVDLHVPGHEIVASRKEHEDPYVAMHEAFQVLYRQLEEGLSRRRGFVKRHEDEHADRGDQDQPTP